MSGGRDQPPVGGHRGRGQARDGVDLVRLVSLVGRVCSSSAQNEAKKAAAVLTVDSLDTPSSAQMKSWLVVARSASAPLRLVGHLGWVHRHEARRVGQPHERMGGRRERRSAGRNALLWYENHKAPGGASMLHHNLDSNLLHALCYNPLADRPSPVSPCSHAQRRACLVPSDPRVCGDAK